MKRSTERILTTHVGSLPRPADLLKPCWRRTAAKLRRAAFAGACSAPVRRDRAQAGRDRARRRSTTARWASRASSTTSTSACRASSRCAARRRRARWRPRARYRSFPEFYAAQPRARRAPDGAAHGLHRPDLLQGPRAAPGRHRQPEGGAGGSGRRGGVHAGDLAVQRRGLAAERATTRPTRSILFAIAEAMREEYKAIVDAGLPAADRRPAAGDATTS